MKKNLLLAAVALFSVSRAAAQCAPGSANLDRPGTWKADFQKDTESTDKIPKAEMPRVLKETEVYADLLKNALNGNQGHAAEWYRSFGGDLFAGGPAKYQINVPLFRFDCEGGKLTHEDEHSEAAAVGVNTVWHMAGPEASTIINGKKHFAFGSPIGQIRGFPAFQTDYGGMAGTRWVVLVARPGKLRPFHFATRREVLDSLKAQAEKETAEMMPKMNDIGRKSAQKQLAKTLARLETVRSRYTPAQLEETAQSHPSAISMAWDTFDFKKTKEESCGAKGTCADGWGRPFALPTRAYYDLTGSPAKPQFFTVVFEWAGGAREPDPRIAKLRDDFFARFDFDKLVSLLGPEKEKP